jgi:leucyl aminopeptidase (aminopeptidase T)
VCRHQEGEVVIITGGVKDFELLEDITVNVRKAGAYPMMFAGSDRLTRKLYTEVPVKYDSQAPLVDLKLLEFTDAIISVDYGEDPGLLADIPPERFITRGKASVPVTDLAIKRNIRGISLGNGLYPTEALAKRYD